MVAKRIGEFLEKKGISIYAFENSLNVSRGSISKAIKDEKNIGSNVLENILILYTDLNPIWLLTGAGDMLVSSEKTINSSEISSPKLKILEPKSKYEKADNVINIPIVDISAAAGYGAINPDHAEQIGSINLPATMLKAGKHYCIKVRGFSMAPTLQDSDYLIIRHVDKSEWTKINDEHIYLVVDRDGVAYVKRIKNRFNQNFIVLTSDSLDKASYPNFNLDTEEISNIFHAEWHFSAKMQNINDTYYNRLKLLEDRMDNLVKAVDQPKKI